MTKSKGRMPTWIDRVPGALGVLRGSEGEVVDRKGIQELLGLTARRAQQVMAVVGALQAGQSHVVTREHLVQYLERYESELKAQEKRGRRRFAETLTRLQQERWEKPQLLVEMPRKQVVEMARRGVNALPEGIEMGSGFVTVRASSMVEMLQKFAALVIVIGQDTQAFEEKICPSSNSPKGAA